MQQFIDDIVDLIIRMERGNPGSLPDGVGMHLVDAIAAFGNDALPVLHKRLSNHLGEITEGYILKALGEIGNPSSAPYLIEYHQAYSTPITAPYAIEALKNTGAEDGYLYLAHLLLAYASGNTDVVETPLELLLAADALGDWGKERAVHPLKSALRVQEVAELPERAAKALAQYPQQHSYLREVAASYTALQVVVTTILPPAE